MTMHVDASAPPSASPAQAAAMPGIPVGVVIKEGWLVKHPFRGVIGQKKRRWMTLLNDRIEWRSAISEPPLGVMTISWCTKACHEGGQLRLYNGDKELAELGVESKVEELIMEAASDGGVAKELQTNTLHAWASALWDLLEAKREGDRQAALL